DQAAAAGVDRAPDHRILVRDQPGRRLVARSGQAGASLGAAAADDERARRATRLTGAKTYLSAGSGVLLGARGEVSDLGGCLGEFAGPPVGLGGGGVMPESGEGVAAGGVPVVLAGQAGFAGESFEV